MHPIEILYIIMGIAVAVAVAYLFRRSMVKQFPTLDHDEPGDWVVYMLVGVGSGIVWPAMILFVLPLYGLAVLISRSVKRRKAR
jgi:hypothetical protein